MSVINTNTKSLVAQAALASTNRALGKTMEQLSTGKKINSASDDAAGLAIVTRMESQSRGLTMAIKNANDAISLTQTAEGAMTEITNMVQRMRELAVQSANAVNNSQDRASLDQEYQQLSAEINRISSTTKFNGQNVLDGTFAGKTFQIGGNKGETLDLSISNMSATSLGRSALSTEANAVTSGTAMGTPAVATIARMTFTDNDTYTFKVDGTTVTNSITGSNASSMVDAINNNLKAAGKTNLVASLSGAMTVEIKNNTGGNVGVTDFTSASNGKASFSVISGGGTNVLLDDTAAVTTSGAANGVPSSSKGVLLDITASLSGKTQSFDLNGQKVTITSSDTDDTIKTKLETALGSTTNFQVLKPTEVVAAGSLAANAGYTAAAAADANKFTIVAASGYSVNVTNYVSDGTAAGVKGTVRAVGGGTEAVLVDASNQLTVKEGLAVDDTSVSLSFSSTTSTYNLKIDGKDFAITGAQLANGTAASTLINAINTTAAASMNTTAVTGADATANSGKVAAGGLNSLGSTVTATTSGATVVGYEIVQNGTTLTIKKLGDSAGTKNGDLKVGIATTGIVADSAVTGSVATFEVSGVSGSTKNLIDSGYGLYTRGQTEATKMTLQVSGDATYQFNLTDTAGTGTVQVAQSAVINGSLASLIANINDKTGQTGITAAADPNNSKALVLTRADGKKIEVSNFTATGSATMLATPNANQGVPKLLNDDPAIQTGSATAAGQATATTAKLAFSGADKYSFKVSDGNSVAIVRATSVSALSGAGTTDMMTEINAALANVASDITASVNSTTGEITFTNAKGGKVELLDYKSDGAGTATFNPATGQGTAKILNDNDGSAATGKSIADLNLLSTGGSAEALSVLDNAMQQVNNERSKLGAVQNRLNYTIDNLTNIVTNTEAARSRIQDTDYAKATTKLAQQQIIQQAATAMLAQANQQPQSVLSLLQ